ncbi:unnamed protein product [Lactuca saligna]|uniref:DUF7054 domain-containing protein n=1 Tax=Lactuca saligna TaxID=75948 RepID=A0AA35YY98_LACSI|nr:unnamed protein product [Lactuca saligna]
METDKNMKKIVLMRRILPGKTKNNSHDNRLLITVNVVASSGPLRLVVKKNDKVSTVINSSLKLYAGGGRLPVLGSDFKNFMLYALIEGSALNPSEEIGSYQARNFVLDQVCITHFSHIDLNSFHSPPPCLHSSSYQRQQLPSPTNISFLCICVSMLVIAKKTQILSRRRLHVSVAATLNDNNSRLGQSSAFSFPLCISELVLAKKKKNSSTASGAFHNASTWPPQTSDEEHKIEDEYLEGRSFGESEFNGGSRKGKRMFEEEMEGLPGSRRMKKGPGNSKYNILLDAFSKSIVN